MVPGPSGPHRFPDRLGRLTRAADREGGRLLAPQDPEALEVWEEILDAFPDRAAARRFRRFAGHRVGILRKPRLALVLPEHFSLARPVHRRDLAAALEVVASVMDQYAIEVVSESRDARRLFGAVEPFSHEAIAGCAGALVLLSRSLNDEVGAIRPSRYVAADPCAYRINKQRLVFEAGRAEWPFAPADDREIAQACCGRPHVFLDEDEELPAFLEALRRLRGQGLPLHVTLSSRADEDLARRVHAAFAEDPRVEVRDAEPLAFEDRSEFQVSNELIALLTRRQPTRPQFLFRRGAFWRVEAPASPPSRSDLYLFRGEESNARGLLDAWLGRHDRDRPRPAIRLGGVLDEPLVSIVVPIYDRTAEIVRMAHSIYEQDYPWIEVVLVSNGSPPETLEAIRAAENFLMKRKYRVRILELARACGSATIPRDVGIRASCGDMACVLDSDDWLDPGYFDFLRKGPWRADTLYYPRKFYRDHGRVMHEQFPYERTLPGPGALENADLIATLRRIGNFMSNSGVCFSRALFDRAGGIDHRLSYGEDLYLWWRCARAGARAEELEGRVNISLHPGNNELVVGDNSRSEAACELARRQELIPWQ
jgi:hypothetical protein